MVASRSTLILSGPDSVLNNSSLMLCIISEQEEYVVLPGDVDHSGVNRRAFEGGVGGEL